MTSGHQILKPHERTWQRVPEWTKDNQIVGKVLLRSWPHMMDKSSKKYRRHHGNALRWMRIINLYFRNCMTPTQVANEPSNHDWKLTPKKVAGLAWDIKRAGDRYLNGIPPKDRGGKRPGAGRPKTPVKSFCFRIRRLPRKRIKKRCLKHLLKRVNSRSSEK
jgi:hypothetical protein